MGVQITKNPDGAVPQAPGNNLEMDPGEMDPGQLTGLRWN